MPRFLREDVLANPVLPDVLMILWLLVLIVPIRTMRKPPVYVDSMVCWPVALAAPRSTSEETWDLKKCRWVG